MLVRAIEEMCPFPCRDMLQTADGQKHFQGVKELFPDENLDLEEWSPEVCKTQNCTVQILHIAKTGYDEGKVEKIVDDLGLPAKVVYLGEENHRRALWNAYNKRAGTLLYSFYPNTKQDHISILELPRAVISPVSDFKPQRLAVSCAT